MDPRFYTPRDGSDANDIEVDDADSVISFHSSASTGSFIDVEGEATTTTGTVATDERDEDFDFMDESEGEEL